MSMFHVYKISPVDNGWFLFKTVNEVLAHLCDGLKASAERCISDDLDIISYEYPEAEEFVKQYNQSRAAAKKAGWDGDMRHEPCVVPIVQDTDCTFGFMWKQDNNGTTFVVLPIKDDKLLKEAYGYEVITI